MSKRKIGANIGRQVDLHSRRSEILQQTSSKQPRRHTSLLLFAGARVVPSARAAASALAARNTITTITHNTFNT